MPKDNRKAVDLTFLKDFKNKILISLSYWSVKSLNPKGINKNNETIKDSWGVINLDRKLR